MTLFSGDRLEETLAKVAGQIADRLSEMGLSPEAVERLKEVCARWSSSKPTLADCLCSVWSLTQVVEIISVAGLS